MSEEGTPVSYQPTKGLSYDPSEEVYWDEAGLSAEITRTFEICHGCRLCFKYCDTFPNLFSLVDEQKGGKVTAITPSEAEEILDTCFECKLCEVQCPYTVRDGHEYKLDFPKLVHRQRAQRARKEGVPFRDRLLEDPDAAGRAARLSLGMANLMNRFPPARWVMEKTLGIHRKKLLPPFAERTFTSWASRTGRLREDAGGEAVLFPTCYVENNEPELGRDTVFVMEKNQVDLRCVGDLACCGMPAWERGDLETVRARANHNLSVLLPFVEAGAKVLAINPTCSMMLRREYPDLVEPGCRAAAERVAAAVMDPSEFLWSIRNEERFNTDFRSTPGENVGYHAPCHLRAQGIGFKGRDLLRKIPGVRPATVMECCGHDGTYAMTVEGFEPSQRVGKKAFDEMKEADAKVWCTDCPLAAIQFEQHAGTKPLHPMAILARAYRENGFPTRVPVQEGIES